MSEFIKCTSLCAHERLQTNQSLPYDKQKHQQMYDIVADMS